MSREAPPRSGPGIVSGSTGAGPPEAVLKGADAPGAEIFRTIIGTIADGIVIVDADGVTRFVNPAAERLFGRSAAELVGEDFGYPVVSGETAELEILNPARGPLVAELRVTETQWEGRPAHLAAIRDITERVRAQAREKQLVREQTLRAAAEVNERRARFLGQASTTLASSLDFVGVLRSLADMAVPFLADWCIIDLLQPAGTLERVAVATASARGAALLPLVEAGTPLTDAESGASQLLRTGEPRLALDPRAPAVRGVLGVPETHPAFEAAGLGACMVIPLGVRDRRLGILTLCDADSGRVFDDDDLELAVEIANRAATAVDNGRLYGAAQEANRAKADFLAVMSHELRTPLNAVIGYADLLLMGVPENIPERSGAQVRRIRDSARHLLSLIEEILTFARMEAGREQLHLAELEDVGVLAREVISIIEPLARKKQLETVLTLPDAPVRAELDPQKLRQILVNLLSNAVKFTDGGRVELAVRPGPRDVSFVVHDTGRGIAGGDVPRIFDPFWQAEQSRTRHAEGTGLGLAVARRLAHLMGGDIFVESKPGDGSEFTVRLPRSVPRALRKGHAETD